MAYLFYLRNLSFLYEVTVGLPLSIAFIHSRGIEGIQLLSSCLYPRLPSLNQLPKGEGPAVLSVKGWLSLVALGKRAGELPPWF